MCSMALVSIKVTVGSSVLLENAYEASSEMTPKNVVEPGPGENYWIPDQVFLKNYIKPKHNLCA